MQEGSSKHLVEDMEIEELRSIVSDRIHEEIQEQENTFGQEGAFEEMIGWSEDIFGFSCKDFDLEDLKEYNDDIKNGNQT